MRRDLAVLLVLLLFPSGSEGLLAPWRDILPPTVPDLLPPPRTPEHGHQHEHRSGARLRFDAGLGVYTVAGEVGTYYYDDGFLRRRGGEWEFSDRPDGPWSKGRPEWVPLRLRVATYHSAR